MAQENQPLIVRLLIVALILPAAMVQAGRACAQAPFPAPLPGQVAMPAIAASPLPHGAAPLTSHDRTDACLNEYAPLREAAEKHGASIRAAADRRAPPDEACDLIGHFRQAELRLIRFVEVNAARCGILPKVADQLRTAHASTGKMQEQVCAIALRKREPAGPVGDFWPASSEEVAGAVGGFRTVR